VRLRVATDTYTSVLLDLHFKVAEATARLVLAAAARNPGRGHRTRAKTGPPTSAASDHATRPEPVRPKRSRRTRHNRKARTTMTPMRHPKTKAA